VLLALIGLMAGFGCREDKAPPTRMEQVMAVHDSVMPRMSEIGRLVGRLKPLADSTAQGQRYQKAMEDLQAANKAMMDWMSGFGDRFNHDEIMKGKELSAQKQEWLMEEEVRVKTMADQVNSSIAAAEALLAEKQDP
jgi:hypothetical protein